MFYKVKNYFCLECIFSSIYSVTEKRTQLVDIWGGNSILTLCRFGKTIGTKMLDVKTGKCVSLKETKRNQRKQLISVSSQGHGGVWGRTGDRFHLLRCPSHVLCVLAPPPPSLSVSFSLIVCVHQHSQRPEVDICVILSHCLP